MATANLSRNINLNTKKLFESLVKLGNLTVPCVALVYTKGEVLDFGTTVCRQKLKKTLKFKCKCTCTADNNETWDNILKSEQLDIITSQEKAFDMTVIEEIGVLNLAISSTLLQRLPAPINLLNYKETIDMVCYVLKRDHSKQGLPGIEIKYGSPSWQPSPDGMTKDAPGLK